MAPILLIVELLTFFLTWWLGLYLLARNLHSPHLRFTGLGLAVYALALAIDILSRPATELSGSQTLARWGWPLLFLPAYFWFGSLLYLLPESSVWRQRFGRPLAIVLIPAAVLFYLLAVATDLIITISPAGDPQPGPWYGVFAVIVLLELASILFLLIQALRSPTWGEERPSRPKALLLAATLFFTLGTLLLIFPLGWLPGWLLVVGVAGDLVVLGVAIALLDAFEEGETLLPDFLRSLTYSCFVAVLFGGQVVLIMFLGTGLTLAMLVLLLLVIATAVVTQTFADPIQVTLDNVVFARFPRIRQARSELRAAASAVPRTDDSLDLFTLTESQFNRHTRSALSNMGNLPRLAASPLTRLPLVETRMAGQGLSGSTLERAAELKAILTESIERLKPRDQGDFGTADEWRHYNALYFPYVAGLRPYSRRANHYDLDKPTKAALNWFQSQVPERTLYNWQKAAAELVAQDLREQMDGYL
jgi:hypothetical protein